MREYISAQGDTWDIISFKQYGTEKEVATLIEANPAWRNAVIFPANARLTIPDIDTQQRAPAPPWRRNNG